MLASLIFYSWGGIKYTILILISILVNYVLVLAIDSKEKGTIIKKVLLISTIIFNVGILGYYKYFNFIFDNIICKRHIKHAYFIY